MRDKKCAKCGSWYVKCGHKYKVADTEIGTAVYFAPAGNLSGLLQDVRDGKIYGVIPTAIGTTAVVKVLPTELSSKEVQLAVKKTEEEALAISLSKPTIAKSADRTRSLLEGFLR